MYCIADIYALGVVLLFMVSGELPFDDRNPSETVVEIMEGRYLSFLLFRENFSCQWLT